MKGLVRPRGPKPAAVYWRRRLVLLALVALVAVGVRWLADDESTAASTDSSAAATPAETSTPSSEPSARADKQQSRGGKSTKPAKKPARTPEKRPITTRLQPPQGACDVERVVAVPDVADTEAGGLVPIRLGLSVTAGEACELQLSAADLALEITSGDDLIWTAADCPEVLEETTVTLRPGWLTYATASWNGRRATDECAATNQFAEPGYYWAEAALIGGEPARGQFRLEEPPPPPKKQESPTGDGTPDASPTESPAESPTGSPAESPTDSPTASPTERETVRSREVG